MARINRTTAIAPAPTGVSGNTKSLRQCQLGWHSAASLFQPREDLTSPLIEVGRVGRYGATKLGLNSLPFLLEEVPRTRDVAV